MVSTYFLAKTATKKFNDDLKRTLKEIHKKQVLLYGAGEGFMYLLDKYPFKELNIVAVADKKFCEETVFEGFKAIPPEQIFYQKYDVILITNEQPSPICNYIQKTLKIENKAIMTVFNEDISEERDSFFYLEHFNFGQYLRDLNKKLRCKNIVIYGAGILFEAVNEFYDLRDLNIIAISDRRFKDHSKGEKFLGYPVCSPNEIKDLKPDYVLVATKFYINIIEDLYYNTLKGTKIKVKPLIKKPFKTLINEIWG